MLKERLRRILSSPNLQDLREGLEELVGRLIRRYNPRSVIIAGSLAQGTFVRGMSDIDILIITDNRPSKYERFLLTAIKDVDVQVSVYSNEEIEDALRAGNQFIVDAINKGIEVYRRVEKDCEHQ